MSEDNKPHARIYLQGFGGYESTWCEDKINEDDVEYVLSSELEKAYEKGLYAGKESMKDKVVARLRELEQEQYTIHGFCASAYESMSPEDCIKHIEKL